MPDTLRGQIERITFHNPDNGFVVLRILLEGRGEPVTLVGTALVIAVGELIEARGQWVVDREHGRQFKATEIRTDHPTSGPAIERYLGSGAIKGLGKSLAAKIVSLYKERSLLILDQYADMLLHIRGIGSRKLAGIRQSWQEQKGVRELSLFLAQYGVGTSRAVRIWRTYGADSIRVLRQDPYRLAADIRGIGFKTADDLARKLGLDPHAPERLRAGARHALSELASEGHCGYPTEGVVAKACALLETPPDGVEAAIRHEVGEGTIVAEPIDGQEWLFLASLHAAEKNLAEAVRKRLESSGHPLAAIDVEAALAWVQQKLSIELAAAQEDAVRRACREKLLVVTGGPGVGKTTLVRSILEIFAAKGLACALAAPTGRAAKRLAETTGREARTLHRLLEFDPVRGRFQRDARFPLEGDLFILDEASMLDASLAWQFFRALPQAACVVLVGDVDQLPSVGPGAVLADLIDSGRAPVARRTEIFRQAQHSRIVAAAHAVHQGRLPEGAAGEELSDFYVIHAEDPETIRERVVRLVRERIPERFGLDPRREVQVLVPMNRSLLGARSLNQSLQEALNPSRGQAEINRYGTVYRVGDRVLQTENDYQRNVFNGDLGLVAAIDEGEQELTVEIDGRPVVYDFGDLDQLALAYALTIHKSQGSEYPCVVLPLHTQHFLLLQRNLLYTGLTRGRKLVVLVASQQALELAVRRQDTRRRLTTLGRRLRKE